MKKELTKRYILFIIGLFFMAIGVAFTKRGELGVSPVSSVPNILSYKFDFFTMGTWLIIWNCMLIAAQLVILKKDFKPIQLLQIPVSFLFGWFTDFGLWCLSEISLEMYILRLAFVVIGTVVLGFGVSVCFNANVIMNAGEAFVKTVADRLNKNFGNVKIVFDISNVLLSVIMSLIFFDFKIVGAREGTLIAAVFTGVFVKIFNKALGGVWNKLLKNRGKV